MVKIVICTQNTGTMGETMESLGCILNRKNILGLTSNRILKIKSGCQGPGK